MITDKIKTLFSFIEFLHSNIEKFKQYDEVINELYLLDNERKKLKPRKNFTDKLKYDEIQYELKNKFKVIKENIIQQIQAKANELNICYLNKTETLWNWNISEVHNLKENFSKNDITEILQHKSKYIEFRTKTNCTYFQDFFFDDLDEILKELFDFFKESTENEFEVFETKTIQVNSFREAVEQIQKGQKKITLPIDFLNLSQVQQSNNEVLPPYQTETKTGNLNLEIDKDLSITEKLNYWQNIIETNISKPLKKKYGNYYLFNYEAEKEQGKILTKLFGLKYKLVSTLLIPEHIYNKHFENGLNEPEFTYWFLQYNAQIYFEVEIRMKHLPEKLNTPLSENFIKAELKKLNDFEQKAENLLHESKFDIYNEYSYSEYAKEIEYLRIKAGYYKSHALPSVHAIGNTTVVLYAEHILLKEFLKNELKKTQPSQQPKENTPPNRLQLIKEEVVTNKWANGSLAQMRYNAKEIWHQVAGYHWEGETLYKNHSDIVLDTVNFPVITKGLTAYLIQNLAKPEHLIFDKYYENCLNSFKQVEVRKPGSSMRNLDAEYYPIHIAQEKEFVTFSEKIHPYLSKAEIELIYQYTEAYFKYIEQLYSPKGSTEEGSLEKQEAGNELSVPDWCIIFYYIDEAVTKVGNKIDRMKKFIEDNKVVNPSGTLTTKGNFKKEYYEIENRINIKNDKKALPPKRIENILPYLKNNKEAMQNAVSDIDYLTNEIEENKKKYY